jgi:hypothetical protein
MSLFQRFSLVHNLAKVKRSIPDNNNTTVNMPLNRNQVQIKEGIDEQVVETLFQFHFTLEQIMMAHKLYNFTTVEEAVYIMMKDAETSKYNHRFIKTNKHEINNNHNNNNNIEYEQSNTFSTVCAICADVMEEHIDYDDNNNMNIESSSNNNNDVHLNVMGKK